MAEEIRLTDSVQRVAFDLMKYIDGYTQDATRDRAYYIKLYIQCLDATTGSNTVEGTQGR